MTIWSWLFLISWPVVGVLVARFILESLPPLQHWRGLARVGALVLGMAVAAFWPFWAVPVLLYWFARRFLVTSRERAAARQQALEQARRQAAAYGLPFPEQDVR